MVALKRAVVVFVVCLGLVGVVCVTLLYLGNMDPQAFISSPL